MLLLAAVLTAAGGACRREAKPNPVPPRHSAAVMFDRDVLPLKLAFGTRASARLPVVGARAREAHLVPHPATHPQVVARVLADAIAVDVTARPEERGLPVGTHVGNIVVDTGLPEAPRLTMPYSIRVTGTLDVSPTNPYFNLRDPEARARTIVVRGTAAEPPFQINAAEIASGPFTATVEKVEPGVFHVKVSVKDLATNGDERGVLGRLVIRSNDPTEPVKEIPLLALGPSPVPPSPLPPLPSPAGAGEGKQLP